MNRLILGIFSLLTATATWCAAERPPNIVYIMSDELAYYELSHMGHGKIKTPRIDQFAAEGIRFTRALAGSPVCAPLRCNLLTGKHSGHASVRANDGGTPLREDEVTIASMLKPLGYATGGFGKWGCGGRNSTGVPEKHGFDIFFGYYDQVHAHSFYPPYLIKNSEEVVLPGNAGGRRGQTYAHYPIMEEGLKFIRENKDKPFFCYLPITPPHGMYDIPKSDPAWDLYEGEAWIDDPGVPRDAKNYAAMVTMVDRNVGEIVDLLKELGLEENTIVFFTGDNGGYDHFSSREHPRGYFAPNVDPKTGVGFRGGKGNLYEGGLRIPFLARWPGKIQPGQVSDLITYQPDIMPTLAELTGAEAPDDLDGISILPTLLGEEAVGREQETHEMLYWEYRGSIAVRMGHWKAIKPKQNEDWELYNLETDVSESNDIAADHADILAKMQAFAKASHEPVRPGFYYDDDRTLHEKDRKAKWGTTRAEAVDYNRRIHRLSVDGLVPKLDLKVIDFSAESFINERLAENAIDHSPWSEWHTGAGSEQRGHPHYLVIDLGATHEISAFYYLPRQDSSSDGLVSKATFHVAEKPEYFREPVVEVSFDNSRKPHAVRLPAPVRGRYVRFTTLGDHQNRGTASAAEIGIAATKLSS